MIAAQSQVLPYLAILDANVTFTAGVSPVEVVGKNIDYKFLQKNPFSHDETRIYVIEDLNRKITRACTEIIIQFRNEFSVGYDGERILGGALINYEILFQGFKNIYDVSEFRIIDFTL